MTQTTATQQRRKQAANRNTIRPFHVKVPLMVIVAVVLAVLAGVAISAQDKYSLQVPNGLAFSDFRDTKTGRLSPLARPKTCSR